MRLALDLRQRLGHIRASELGLASTTALLEQYSVADEQRERLECRPRPSRSTSNATGCRRR